MATSAHPFHSSRSATLAAVAKIVGVEAAVRLSAMCGGQRVWVAYEPRADSPLVKAIGQVAADGLARVLGGNSIDVPLGEGRRFRIVMLRVIEKATIPAIALKIGCGERHVYQVLADHERNPILPELATPAKDPNQFLLFDSE